MVTSALAVAAAVSTPGTEPVRLSVNHLVILAIGVLLAAGLTGGIGVLLNRHYRLSREKAANGDYVGTRKVDVTFARVVALLSVATMAVIGLGMSVIVSSDLVAAYFTLLGTIGGYLIGAKTGSVTSTETVAPVDAATGQLSGNVTRRTFDTPSLG